jgi:pyruvate dehydrogenase E1 component
VRLAREAQDLLEREWGVAADVWSVTSWNELRRQALAVEECALFDSGAVSEPWLTTQLAASSGPVIAVSDWMRAVPDQIARWVPRPWLSLGTDGFGHSDTRTALRRHFRIDAESITVGVLRSLEREATLPAGTAQAAIDRYGLSTRG